MYLDKLFRPSYTREQSNVPGPLPPKPHDRKKSRKRNLTITTMIKIATVVYRHTTLNAPNHIYKGKCKERIKQSLPRTLLFCLFDSVLHVL